MLSLRVSYAVVQWYGQMDLLVRVLTGIRYTLEVKKMCYRRSCKHTISRTGDACQWSGQLQYGDDMGLYKVTE